MRDNMKELTKQIRKDVKELIERVGGTDNILCQHKTELKHKYTTEEDRRTFNDKMVEVCTTVDNQINYFRYRKGM